MNAARSPAKAAPTIWLTAGNVLLAGAALVGLVFLLDPWIHDSEQGLGLSLLNAAPLLLIWLPAGALFRRVWAPAIITAFVAWLLYDINGIKLEELAQPLLFTDILLTAQVVGNTDLLARYSQPLFLLTIAATAVLLVAIACRLEPARPGWGSSAVLSALTVILILVSATGPVSRTFAQHGSLATPWSPIESVRKTGLLASLAASAGKDLVELPTPDEVHLDSIRTQLAGSLPTAIPMPQPKPDIVVILSESFFEPGLLNGVETCNYLPQWCALKASGASGQMRIPTYGGNTTRTEFEVLTGIPYNVLPAGIYPFTSVVRRPMVALPQWLQHLGYATTAVHPHKRTFWQRHRAYPLLGFERFVSEENMTGYTRKGWFISDADMTDQIVDVLDQNGDKPQFLFAISMENHGPWNRPRPDLDQERLADIPFPEGLDETGQLAWRQYIYHAQNAIEEMQRLMDYLSARERPFVVLFFGDHLPGLASVYETLGFRDGNHPSWQPTPYLLLANDGSVPSALPVDRSYQLPMQLLQASKLPSPMLYRQLAATYSSDPDKQTEGTAEALQIALLHADPQAWPREYSETAVQKLTTQ